VSAVWDRFCGEALDATLAALLVSTVGMIVLVSCRQPARRGWIARGVPRAFVACPTRLRGTPMSSTTGLAR
jgi:hypothetical protein